MIIFIWTVCRIHRQLLRTLIKMASPQAEKTVINFALSPDSSSAELAPIGPSASSSKIHPAPTSTAPFTPFASSGHSFFDSVSMSGSQTHANPGKPMLKFDFGNDDDFDEVLEKATGIPFSALSQAKTAPTLQAKTAPPLQAKTAPPLQAKPAPTLQAKPAPTLQAKTAPTLQAKTAPQFHPEVAIITDFMNNRGVRSLDQVESNLNAVEAEEFLVAFVNLSQKNPDTFWRIVTGLSNFPLLMDAVKAETEENAETAETAEGTEDAKIPDAFMKDVVKATVAHLFVTRASMMLIKRLRADKTRLATEVLTERNAKATAKNEATEAWALFTELHDRATTFNVVAAKQNDVITSLQAELNSRNVELNTAQASVDELKKAHEARETQMAQMSSELDHARRLAQMEVDRIGQVDALKKDNAKANALLRASQAQARAAQARLDSSSSDLYTQAAQSSPPVVMYPITLSERTRMTIVTDGNRSMLQAGPNLEHRNTLRDSIAAMRSYVIPQPDSSHVDYNLLLEQ